MYMKPISMDDRVLYSLYSNMYDAMVKRDRNRMEKLFADSYSITHFNGMSHTKQELISEICTYKMSFSEPEHMPPMISHDGKTGTITGRSYVKVMMKGACGNLRLQQLLFVEKDGNDWIITKAVESMY